MMKKSSPSALQKQFAAAALPSAAAKPKKKAIPPLSLRLSADERARLERDAANQPLSAYIRSRLFDGKETPRRKSRKPALDHDTLARALGMLGRSGLAQSLDKIAKAAQDGTLPGASTLEADINRAVSDIAAMRNALIAALGLQAK